MLIEENAIDQIIETLIQEVDTAIPEDLKQKLQSMEFRKALFAKHGRSAFLDSTRLKFPIYDMEGPNCNLIYAAYLRSSSRTTTGSSLKKPEYYSKIAKKAKSLFSKNNCSETLQIQLQEDDAIDAIDLTDLFEFSHDDTELEFIYIE